MSSVEETPEQAWAAFVRSLATTGERLAAQTASLTPMEQADAFRALTRSVNNHLGRFEVDRERPELVFFNGWREKLFMDNPDFRYWVADIRDDRRYRITGAVGDAAFVSITAYSSSGTLDAAASSRLDSDCLTIGADGTFSVVLSSDEPMASGDDWMPLPQGASAVWVRHFHHDVAADDLGRCTIEALDPPPPPPPIDPEAFTRRLHRLGRTVGAFPAVVEAAAAADAARPNEVRHWAEMAGGAAFTEPGIHYLRGGWQLAPGEALVIEGDVPECRYWNVLLSSRFLNSLDHRARPVSCTGRHARLTDGRYRFVLADTDPGGAGNWLDTEGRPFGIVVFRFLQPTTEPALPSARVVPLDEVRS